MKSVMKQVLVIPVAQENPPRLGRIRQVGGESKETSMRTFLLIALVLLPRTALAAVTVDKVVPLRDRVIIDATYRNETEKYETSIEIRCTTLGADGRELSKGKILLKGPVVPGSFRQVHITAKLPDEKPASAKCESEKFRIQWKLWSLSSEVKSSISIKEKWKKLDKIFDHAVECGRYREEAYRKRLGELRKKYPAAKRRGYTLLYNAGGKRRSEHFQCAQAEIDLNR